MPNEGNEAQKGGQPTEIDILRQEVKDQSADEIAQEVKDAFQKAQELMSILEHSREGVKSQFEGTSSDKETAKGKAVDVKKVVQKVLLASIDNKTLVPDDADPQVQDFARLVIQKIGQHINVQSVTELTAPNLYSILHKVVTGKITDINTLAQEFNNIKLLLNAYSPALYKNLERAMISIAKENGLSEDEARNKFAIENQEGDISGSLAAFEDEWTQLWRFNYNKEDRKILFALYTPEGFNDLVEEIKVEIRRKSPGYDEDKVIKTASEELENKILGVMARPLLLLDRSYANEFYDEIARRDIWRGIETTINRLEALLSKLQSSFQTEPELNNNRMFLKKERIFYEMQDKKGAEGEDILRKLPVKKPHTFSKWTKVNLSEYVNSLYNNYKTYLQTRKYLHNVNAIFQRNPGDKGFYEQLTQYSGEISTLIMDEIDLQPDAELFRVALQLYDKYIEEDFASVNWIHQTYQFRPHLRGSKTLIQQEVIDELREMFPEISNENSDRIDAAVNMAMGAARGIYLTEPEKSAYADPNLNLLNDPNYVSYYTRDPFGLIPLNPLHLLLRFQSEGLMNNIFFLPVDSLDQDATWDHNRLLDKIQKYRDSFLKGKEGSGLPEEIFMDFMMNIGLVGGPVKRAGWRVENEYNYLLKFVRGNFQSGEIDYLKSWKNIENIGYEVLVDFIGAIGHRDNFEERDFYGTLSDCPKKKELFEHIFKKYYVREPPDPSKSQEELQEKLQEDLQKYYSRILKKARNNVHEDIKEGKIAPKSLKQAMHLEASQIFLYRTLSRVIAHRIPTKFIRIERNRMSKDGERSWEKIRQKFARLTNIDFDKDPGQFDRHIKDIMYAETVMRRDISREMKEIHGQEREFYTAEFDYSLDEQKLEVILRRRGLSGERIEKAKALFKLISQDYSGNDDFLDDFGENFIRDKEYPFTFALEELDTSFLAFRSTGQNMLTRAIGEIDRVDKEVIKELFEFAHLLHNTSIDGKKDFSKIVESINKMKRCVESMHGKEPSHILSKNMAALAISYFKKDTSAKAFFGAMSMDKIHSLAGEFAGRSSAVWEWEAREIDDFVCALESANILPRSPFEKNKPAKQVPLWIKNPITGKMMKTPFKTRKKDFFTTSQKLRKGFGADFKSIGFDMINKYLPILLAFLLWKYISAAFKETEDEKK